MTLILIPALILDFPGAINEPVGELPLEFDPVSGFIHSLTQLFVHIPVPVVDVPIFVEHYSFTVLGPVLETALILLFVCESVLPITMYLSVFPVAVVDLSRVGEEEVSLPVKGTVLKFSLVLT